MTTSKSTSNLLLLAVRWTARISSILFIGVFMLMFVGEGFDPAKVRPLEWLMLFFGPFGLMLGMILGWWKEGLGGAITILSLFISLLVGDYSGSGGGYMLICASPGFLFLLSWLLSKTMETPNMPAHEGDASLPSAPLITDTKVLETRQARVAAKLCPKCGIQLKPTDQNCPSCRINLAFAREHLDAW